MSLKLLAVVQQSMRAVLLVAARAHLGRISALHTRAAVVDDRPSFAIVIDTGASVAVFAI